MENLVYTIFLLLVAISLLAGGQGYFGLAIFISLLAGIFLLNAPI